MVLAFFLSGCSSLTRFIYKAPFTQSVKKEDIVAAVVNVLQSRGFTITTANEKLGLITTDWKSLTDAGGAGWSKALWGSADYRRMKISVSVNDKTNLITINPVVGQTTEKSNRLMTSSTNESEATMNEGEVKLVNKIVDELMTNLNLNPGSVEVIKQKED